MKLEKRLERFLADCRWEQTRASPPTSSSACPSIIKLATKHSKPIQPHLTNFFSYLYPIHYLMYSTQGGQQDSEPSKWRNNRLPTRHLSLSTSNHRPTPNMTLPCLSPLPFWTSRPSSLAQSTLIFLPTASVSSILAVSSKTQTPLRVTRSRRDTPYI